MGSLLALLHAMDMPGSSQSTPWGRSYPVIRRGTTDTVLMCRSLQAIHRPEKQYVIQRDRIRHSSGFHGYSQPSTRMEDSTSDVLGGVEASAVFSSHPVWKT